MIPDVHEKIELARRFGPPASGVYRVSPALWNEILKIVSNSPKTRRRVRDLQQAVAEANHPTRRMEGGLEVFERDAIASALQVFGGPTFRKRVLREAGVGGTAPNAPFLERLETVAVREDPQIGHDQISFPGRRLVLKSRAVRGPKGGIAVTWQNSRRLINSEFTSLLRNGWIGSAAGESKELTRVIEDVLAAGRMLVLAATSKGPRFEDFRRDDWGRFAAEDDPSAAT